MSDLGMAHALRKRGKSVAQGGASGSADEQDADMIARIMKKRSELANPPAESLDTDPLDSPEMAEPEDDISRIMQRRKASATP